jgi:hypothetical protein
MPSHKLHRLVGLMMGLRVEAVELANRMIDMPEEFPELRFMNIEHDDETTMAMFTIRYALYQLYGEEGMLAADLHYSLGYIDRWLDPEMARRMVELLAGSLLSFYPKGRSGFVDPLKRLWWPKWPGYRVVPIIAYCNTCRGVKRPTNSPFCKECHANELRLKGIDEIPEGLFLLMLKKRMDERKIDQKVREFVEENLTRLIELVTEDRKARGLKSLKIRPEAPTQEVKEPAFPEEPK